MKNSSKIYELAAAVTAGVLMGEAAPASASAGLGGMVTNVATAVSTVPVLISSVAYIGGVGLGMTGIFKLKQHVDNPAQTPLREGLVRLGSGGGLLSMPFVTDAMARAISNGDNTQAAVPVLAPAAISP